MNIVVVEDEVKTRTGLVRLIGKINSDFVVVGEAKNGLEGMEVIERLRPDLVFVDINMPLLNGIKMLELLKEKGIHQKTVILSGYSEFEYAKKAIQIGVTEYLLKPITVEDLTQSLNLMQSELLRQKLSRPLEGDLNQQSEHILHKFLLDGDVTEEAMNDYLYKIMGFDPDKRLDVINIYLGIEYELNKMMAKNTLLAYLDEVAGSRRIALEISSFHEVLAICQTDQTNCKESEANPGKLAFELAKLKHVVSNAQITAINQLSACVQQIRENRPWSIVIGNQACIAMERIEAVTVKQLPYPVELESRAKAVLSSAEPHKAGPLLESFLSLIYKEPYHPRHILESCVRFLSSLLHIAGEIHPWRVSYVDRQQLLNQLMKSQTRDEIGQVFEQAGTLISDTADANPQYSVAIHKTIRLIHERYQSGLSLDETANMLNLTPEYLSTLFNKEVGKSFTVYLKEVRIKKAMGLLLQTDLKTFEIAERIGYSDPKYFNRVFKEATGMTPGEYQKVHK